MCDSENSGCFFIRSYKVNAIVADEENGWIIYEILLLKT